MEGEDFLIYWWSLRKKWGYRKGEEDHKDILSTETFIHTLDTYKSGHLGRLLELRFSFLIGGKYRVVLEIK